MKVWRKVHLKNGDWYFPGDILCATESAADKALALQVLSANVSVKAKVYGYEYGYWILRQFEEENEFGLVSP